MRTKQLTKLKSSLRNLTTPLLFLGLMIGCVGAFCGSVSAASITKTVPIVPASDDPEFEPGRNWTYTVSMVTPADNTLTTSGGDVSFSTWRLDLSSVCKQAKIESMRVTSESVAANPNNDMDGVVLFAYTNKTGMLTSVHSPNYTIATGNDMASLQNSMDVGSFRGINARGGTFPIAGQMDVTYSNLGVTQSSIVGFGIVGDTDNNTGSITSTVSSSVDITYDDLLCNPQNSAPSISPSSTIIPSSTPSGSTVVAGSILKATDPDGDKLNYSITLGNDSNYFTIDPITGDITTTKTNIPAGTYTLTIQVDDGKGGRATAVVSIVVTDTSIAAPENNASPSSNAKQMKPMLANTGQSISALAVISATLLSLVVYLRIKSNKKNRSYIKR